MGERLVSTRSAHTSTELILAANPADTDRFGYKMLEKMGWSEGGGLGAKGDGVKSHLKVTRKNNALGRRLLSHMIPSFTHQRHFVSVAN